MILLQRLLCCAFVIMLSSTGWARIGETILKCAKRYQPGMARAAWGKDEATFIYKGVWVSVKAYDTRKVQWIRYMSSPPEMEPLLEELLAVNAPSAEWVAVEGKPYNRETKDGKLRAAVSRSVVTIWTLKSEEAEKEKPKPTLEGF
jgi:hypothetical protein